MPALTTITVDDRELTPVSHVYIPGALKSGVFEFANTDGVPIGDEKLTISSTVTNNGNYKIRVRMQDPVVVTETINGVDNPRVARTAFADFTFTFSNHSSVQERKNLVGKIANLLQPDQTFMMEVLEELKGIY